MTIPEASRELLVIDGEPTAVPTGAVAFKYDDAVESACWLFDAEEAEQIAREDPAVIVWAGRR
ncbi:MAG: hypothetical protein WAM30_17275 [Candidatus Dormiibacterota bacterium]